MGRTTVAFCGARFCVSRNAEVAPPGKGAAILKQLVLVIILLLFPSVSSALSGKVINVADGDTITVLSSDNLQTKIRLYGIDCPEKAQAFGQKAKKFTAALVAGKTVDVRAYDIDKYGRTVGVVQVDGINVNEEILKAGLGWQYRKYCKESFCGNWALLETETRKAGFGLWRDTSPTPPWDWRKGVGTQPLSNAGGKYHGNQKSFVFHQSSCKAFNCKNCVISFDTRESAIKAGYRPCGICKP